MKFIKMFWKLTHAHSKFYWSKTIFVNPQNKKTFLEREREKGRYLLQQIEVI